MVDERVVMMVEWRVVLKDAPMVELLGILRVVLKDAQMVE